MNLMHGVRISSLAAALALAFTPGSAQAGFFENLFGGAQPAEPVAPTYGSDQPQPQFGGETPVARPKPPRRKAVVDTKPKLQMPTDLMHDGTLQNGDAVMMKDGVHVYTGDDDDKQHSKADFTALDKVDGMGKDQQKALIALDTARNDPLRGVIAPDTVASGRSAAVATPIVRGRDIVDARGKSLRYVGP